MTEFLKKVTKSDIRNIIAVISIVGSFLMLYILIVKPIPAENRDIVNNGVCFILGGLIGGVNGYYFGASKNSSKEKEEE